MDKARVNLDTFDDVVSIVPYLVGFVPEESAVLIVVQDRQVQVTARFDIEFATPEGVRDIWSKLRFRFPSSKAFTLMYSEDRQKAEAAMRSALEVIGDCSAGAGVVAGHVWISEDGRIGRVDTATPAVATVVAEGMQGAGLRRSDLVASFASADDDGTDLPEPVGQLQAEAIVTEFLDSWDGETLPDRETARRLGNAALRTAGWTTVIRRYHEDNAEAMLRLWRSVVNQTPSDLAGGTLGLAGLAGWLTGEGSIATVAMDRMEAKFGQTGMWGLLDMIVTEAYPPGAWTEILGMLPSAEALMTSYS